MTDANAQIRQITLMLELQDSMNSRVHLQWREQGNEWYRAIWVECAELLDHYGWKWWKKQTPDIEQVALELIDIWHFGLSILLQSGKSTDTIAALIQQQFSRHPASGDFRADLETFALETLRDREFHIDLFATLMAGINFSFEQLYRGYIGKNVLNFFRQDNGYKTGTYRKLWRDGREDNEHLVEIVASLDATAPTFKDDVYTALTQRYGQD